MKANLVNLPEVKKALKKLETILVEHPEAIERTAAFFAGDLAALEDKQNEKENGEKEKS